MPLLETKGAGSAQGFGLTLGSSYTPTYIEEVFSTWLYTGNGSTQTITNGIDLSTKGGLVWSKSRTTTGSSGNDAHWLIDTDRGASSWLRTNLTNGNFNSAGSSFLSNGVSLSLAALNVNAVNYASWTFRKQAKFFDVVTYTGDGNSNRTVSHSLGSVPGCIIIKRTDVSTNWIVWHRGDGTTNYNALSLNSTDGSTASVATGDLPTSTTFKPSALLGSDYLNGNANGGTYVAYLFAHNAGGFGLTGTDNVISCGSVAVSSGGQYFDVNLGYEPQWILIKGTATSNWEIYDSMRGLTSNNDVGTAISNRLIPNTTAAENNTSSFQITSTGFSYWGNSYNSWGAMIYIAIRRGPMKTPTTGTSVFDPEAYTGTSATRTVTSGFPVDLSASKIRSQGFPGGWFDRLRGALQVIRPSSTDAEATSSGSLTGFDSMTGVVLGSDPSGRINTSPDTYAMWNFRRAPGFFDVVCYTGTGSTDNTVNHNLGVAPEMMIVRIRNNYTVGVDASGNWAVYHAALGNQARVQLNLTNAVTTGTGVWYSTTPTATTFKTSADDLVNKSASGYVAYLFASCPGVSKVGSYTGTGALQTINCGFTGGARFVLIKRTDSTGDWFTYDSARGITSGNDPYLLMNSTAAEVTGTNYVDTTSVGFQVTAAAPAGLNANGGTYIFLAIA